MTVDEILSVLLACRARGFVLHEQKQLEVPTIRAFMRGDLSDAVEGSRFTIILGDGRLVSSQRFEPRAEALARVAAAVVPYLPQFEIKAVALE